MVEMNERFFINLAERILSGETPAVSQYQAIVELPAADYALLLDGADRLRARVFGKSVHLCTIMNGKSGRCSEDCRFCSQSRFAETDAPVFPMKTHDELRAPIDSIRQTAIHRYSIVTSGRGLGASELGQVTEAFRSAGETSLSYCASLGIIGEAAFKKLKDAGVSRYHHNLETAESHFHTICTTHTFEDRVNTIRAAKAAGLTVCAGGLFGIGENDEQIMEMALTLKSLDVDAVPVNFLSPIQGTPLASANGLTPERCIKIVALLRYILVDKEIIVCGGRVENLGALHHLIFAAGANGIMTGNYLTTDGRTLAEDLDMISDLGYSPKEK